MRESTADRLIPTPRITASSAAAAHDASVPTGVLDHPLRAVHRRVRLWRALCSRAHPSWSDRGGDQSAAKLDKAGVVSQASAFPAVAKIAVSPAVVNVQSQRARHERHEGCAGPGSRGQPTRARLSESRAIQGVIIDKAKGYGNQLPCRERGRPHPGVGHGHDVTAVAWAPTHPTSPF